MSVYRDSIEESSALLRAYLANRDVECPQCQYNLRDQQGDRCPECGEQIVLRLNLAEPKLGTLIAGLVGLSAGAGFSGLMLLYIAIQMMIRRGFSSRELWWFVSITGISFAIEGAALVYWIVRWRAIRQLSTQTRVWLVVFCWVLTLVNILVFSLGIR